MRHSFPLGLGYALANLIVRLDVLVLSAVVSLSEIGQFSAADNLLVIAYLAAWLFGSVLLPEMVKLSDSAAQLDRFLNQWIRVALLVVVPAAFICVVSASKVIVALYGRNFAHAGDLASWMALACPFIVLNSLYLHHTIAIGAKRAYLWTLFAAASLTVVLNYTLALHFGATGVAVAVLVRESVLSLVLWLRHSRARGPALELEVSVPS
jgi:O-antigen/teichoic acid export membrane protein